MPRNSLAYLLPVFATVFLPGTLSAQLKEIHQDFRGNQRPQAPFEVTGPNAEHVSKPEPEGWRITVPANQPTQCVVGLAVTTPVTGDFDIMAGYEILQADRPTTGNTAGFECFAATQTPTREAIGFARYARRLEGEVLSCSRMTTEDGKRIVRHEHVPATSKAGRLRLQRFGTVVAFSAAAGGAPDFQPLFNFELGGDDLNIVRFGAYAVAGHTAVDVRITDIKIVTGAPPNPAAAPAVVTLRADDVGKINTGPPLAPPAPAAPPGQAAAPSRKSLFLVLELFFVVLLFSLGLLWYVRHRRRGTDDPPERGRRA